ncbi:MAG: hypothetical protein RL654_1782 [Pseudomonadota bacterium]|jgi:DNA-binding transcriptional LysR family regulator
MPSKTRPDAFPPEAPAHAAPADLALFVRVAELGSFSAVARERDGVASQVSRAVDRLEALYRVRLLRRSTHGLSLTPEGGTLLQHARQVLAALGDLADELSARRERASGVVRLAVSPALAQCFVVPALPALAARHPDLRIELHADDRIVDLAAEGFDVALRTNHLRHEGLVARRVGRFRRVVCAAPALLARLGTPQMPADLARFPLVTHLNAGHLNRWTFMVDGERRPWPVSGRFSANTTWLGLEMVRSGLGLGWHSTLLVAPLLARGELVEVLAPFRDPVWAPVWAVMLPERDRLPRIRAVVDFLAEAMREAG